MKKLLLAVFITLLAGLSAMSQNQVRIQNSLDQAMIHKNKAYVFSREGKFADAIAEISRSIELRPDNATFRIDRAGFHRSVNDYTSLEADITDALSLAPDDEYVVFRVVQLFMIAGNCDRALAVADQFIGRHPQKDQAYATRSLVHGCLKNYHAAMNDVTMAIELNPDSPFHRANQARLLSELGSSEYAFEVLRGIIDSLEKRNGEAENPAKKQMRKRELSVMYSTRAGLLNRAGRYEESIADLTRAIELVPDAAQYHSRAMTYRRARKYDAALADYDKLVAIDGAKNAYPFLGRGDIHMMIGNYEKAVADYEQGLKIGTPMKSTIESKIAAAKQKLGQNRER